MQEKFDFRGIFNIDVKTGSGSSHILKTRSGSDLLLKSRSRFDQNTWIHKPGFFFLQKKFLLLKIIIQ